MFGLIRQSTQFLRLGNLIHKSFQSKVLFCTEVPNGPNIEAIINGNKELEHKLKVLILEVDVMRQEGKLVPSEDFMRNQHWKELLEMPTYSARRRYLGYLFKLWKKDEHREIKKEIRKKEFEQFKKEATKAETYEDFVSRYDLSHNSIFLRFYDSTINQMYNNRLIQAMQFGQKLVVDCGYDKNMTKRENQNCAKQLTLLFAENRNHDDPFDLHYCNCNPQSVLMESLNGHIATLHERWFPLNIHESSYLDIFPKEQLVYLTPHCREEMQDYDHDAIYIIGGIVDKVNTEPLSLAKAKREGIRMAKFPLDRHLQWGAGSGKSLTLNQVASILLDLKLTGDWKYALKHVPRRKITEITKKSIQPDRRWKPRKNKDEQSNFRVKNLF